MISVIPCIQDKRPIMQHYRSLFHRDWMCGYTVFSPEKRTIGNYPQPESTMITPVRSKPLTLRVTIVSP